MLKDLKPRLYQETILASCINKNSLVVLPTGLGKTAISIMLAAVRLSKNPNSKILLLAPTKPLCEQHQKSFQKHLEIESEKVVVFTGSVKPEKRAQMWQDAKVIISTPQGLENDLINEKISFEEVSLLTFDEAHHATGDYSYVWLANQYMKRSNSPRILALTASPGSEMEKIQEVCKNLSIENIEVKTDKDPDVKPYIKDIEKEFILLDFPKEYQTLHKLLQDCFKSKLKAIQSLGYCNKTDLNKTQVLKLQRELQREMGKDRGNFEVLKSLSLVAESLKVEHAIGLLECQGVRVCHEYLEELNQSSKKSKVKAVKNLVLDHNFKTALIAANRLVENNVNHPKLPKMLELVEEEINRNQETKILLFSQFRDTAAQIVDALKSQKIDAKIFVGQAKKKGIGMTQKVQQQVLEEFRNGEFPVLVATSVAEEGLDIPRVNKVIFYEPTPSAIRSIQRRGRTGRSDKGELTVLVTKGTRDEAYRWAAHHKENRMYRYLDEIKRMKNNLIVDLSVIPKASGVSKIQDSNNQSLNNFIKNEEAVTILCDTREKDNAIIKELIELGIKTRLSQLESADYIVGGNVAIELKKTDDFVISLLDGRLFTQIKELQTKFAKSVLIVEGEDDIYQARKVHPNAIRGALATIALSFSVPIIYTKDPKDTAQLLAVIAKREQLKGQKDYSLHSSKPQSLKFQQEYVIESFPSVGQSAAKALLEHFKSVENIVKASEEELLQVPGIGKTIVARIKEVLTKEYEKK